jgi:hypothetical protein
MALDKDKLKSDLKSIFEDLDPAVTAEQKAAQIANNGIYRHRGWLFVMIAFQLYNRDIVIQDGRSVLVDGAECMRQRIKNLIQLDRSSWFLGPDIGVNWFFAYNNKTIAIRSIISDVRNVLKSDKEVTGINYINVTLERRDRLITVDFSVSSIYGEVSIQV